MLGRLISPKPSILKYMGPFQTAVFVLSPKMPTRSNGVRIVQVSPDGSLLNYHGPSEQEAAVRLFDTSERPLSSLAERLLENLANDTRRTQGSAAARSNSGWWNGQPVNEEETRNTTFIGPNITSTPQKQPHQDGDVPQPMRPSKVATVNNSIEFAAFNQENPTNIRATATELQRPSHQEQHHVSSTRIFPQVRLEPSEPRQEMRGAFALQPHADSVWLTHSSWTDEPGLRIRSQVEARPPSPSFDVTLDEDLAVEEDQIFSEQETMMGPTANQGADSMMLGNFSPPSNLLSQFVSQDVEEEVDNVMATVNSWRPAALPLPVPKRKPTFSAPFKPNKGSATLPTKNTGL